VIQNVNFANLTCMNINNRILNYPIISFLLILLSGSLQSADLKIISETSTGMTVRIIFDEPFEWRHSENYPAKNSALTFGDAYQVYLSEHLEIPYYQWNIALPSAAQPELIITNTMFSKIKLEKNLLAEDISGLQQLNLARINDIGYLRDVPSASLEIFPLRPGQAPDELLCLRTIELTINFPSRNVAEGRITSEKAEYLNAFVNPASASRWRQPRQLKIQKSQAALSGTWFRITVKSDGIYTITLTDLKNSGLTETSLDTGRIFLYSNSTGGRELDPTIGAAVPDNLVENSRLIKGDGDGYFTTADTMIFYGRSPNGISTNSVNGLVYERNSYSSVNYYWLLIADSPGSPKGMDQTQSLTTNPDQIITETEHLEVHEAELVNFLRSGRYWYGEKFNKSGSTVTILITLPDTRVSYPADLTIATKGGTESANHYYSLYLNSGSSKAASWSGSSYSGSVKYVSTTLSPGINLLKINYTSNSSSACAYLDYIKCLYTEDLDSFSKAHVFWSPLASGIVEYQISNIKFSNPIIFDITDWINVSRQQFNLNGTTASFQTEITTTRRQYFICSSSDYLKPEKIELISSAEWATLRNYSNAYDYIIITDENFRTAAENIAKLYSEELPVADRLKTIVVTQKQILREFNADITDPNAIRFFLKYAFENWAIPPRYVMLLGDGTFDYRAIESSTGNYVMTYQVDPYEFGSNSYASDARFTYISGTDYKMDLAIGRVTVRTASEAQDYYEKLRQYLLEPIYGEWRSRITLVADDPQRPNNNEKEHINDSENYLARYIPSRLMVDKIYLLEYPEVQDASLYGVKKPAATKAILNQLSKGTTIINYLGHGSPTVWAQEYILYMDRDIGLINTGMKLPFWIAGTCSWGHFDDINSTCMPEALISKPEDGGIAVLTPTRATSSTPNASFINKIFRTLFSADTVARIRIGAAVQAVYSGSDSNNEKYVLFGDPALYLALPYQKATFDKMTRDNLAALEKLGLTGQTNTYQT